MNNNNSFKICRICTGCDEPSVLCGFVPTISVLLVGCLFVIVCFALVNSSKLVDIDYIDQFDIYTVCSTKEPSNCVCIKYDDKSRSVTAVGCK